MGMSIDEAMKEIESITVVTDEKQALAFALAVHTMKKYQTLQADYENRLKADMVAMLTELKNKLIDKSWNIDMYDDDLDFECCYLSDIDKLIQQKINALKEEQA